MPTPSCPTCRIAHVPERECVDVLKEVIANFVRFVGPGVKNAPSEEFLTGNPSVPALKAAIFGLVTRNGKRGNCQGCRATIYWVKHAPTPERPAGANCPYTAEGVSHFRDCPKVGQFSRSK